MRSVTTVLVLAALAICPSVRAAQETATNQAPVKTYRNPLLPEREIADPFVLRVEGKYYLYPTTDSRGYEVFVSEDLVHWERKARAFSDPRGGDWAGGVS
jgi:beta-xylosidase